MRFPNAVVPDPYAAAAVALTAVSDQSWWLRVLS